MQESDGGQHVFNICIRCRDISTQFDLFFFTSTIKISQGVIFNNMGTGKAAEIESLLPSK